jgi:hypothetical protein
LTVAGIIKPTAREVLWRQPEQGLVLLTASPLTEIVIVSVPPILGGDVDNRVDLLPPARDRHIAQFLVDVFGVDRLAVERIGVHPSNSFPASGGVNMKSARPAFAPLFFHACAVSLGMNAHVPALPRETESPILKEKSPLKTHMASSLV